MAYKVSENKEAGTITIGVVCAVCKKEYRITAPKSAVHAWQRGALVQDVLPMLSADERELLMSDICGTCFDRMFS